MAKKYSGGTSLGTGFKLNDPQPIADYMVVELITDLDTLPNQFNGMLVFVEENEKYYSKKENGWEIHGSGDFVPLSGTEVGKPITGDLGFTYPLDDYNYGYIGMSDFGDYVAIKNSDKTGQISWNGFAYNDGINVFDFNFDPLTGHVNFSTNISESKGIVGIAVFNKQNDPNAFAQLGDINDAIAQSNFKRVNADYTLLQADSGKYVLISGNNRTITIPDGLTDEFHITLDFEGTGGLIIDDTTTMYGDNTGFDNGTANNYNVPQNGSFYFIRNTFDGRIRTKGDYI